MILVASLEPTSEKTVKPSSTKRAMRSSLAWASSSIVPSETSTWTSSCSLT